MRHFKLINQKIDGFPDPGLEPTIMMSVWESDEPCEPDHACYSRDMSEGQWCTPPDTGEEIKP